MPMRHDIFVCGLTACLLCGVMADRLALHTPGPEVRPYHARVREALARVPESAGPWVGHDVPVPPAAVDLLHPNALLSREYINRNNGYRVQLLLVQCSDARDLVGHYPPRCYAAQGWRPESVAPRDWQAGGLTIHGTRYEFVLDNFAAPDSVVVDDFMVLPDGSTCPDMAGVDAAARDRRRKFFGAAQVQMRSPSLMPPEEREQAIGELISSLLPLIDTVRSGVRP